MRYNSAGILKEDLKWVLQRSDLVDFQVRRGECFLCCSKPINKAGLCEICMSYLSDTDFELAQKVLRDKS